MFQKKIKSFCLIVVAYVSFCGIVFAQTSPASEADLKKQAEKKYIENDFAGAMPLYSQLLSLYPKSTEYNYHYGVCLLQASRDKTAAVSYLEMASRDQSASEDVFYYLARAYMLINNFNEALRTFESFKKRAGTYKSKKMDVDLYISNCKSAKELLKNRKNVVIINQQQVARNSFFSAYSMDSSSGKILATPERFLTQLDKEKILNPAMFLTKDGQTIYYASYGKHPERNKDIFRINKLPNGDWGEPENLGNVINTEFDEHYPFLDHDGKTLYFCSKGHNSIGGYDIFKSVFDLNTGQWSEPENLGIPINTPDDDILYIPNITGDYAQYASAIESDKGKIGVRKIKLGDVINKVVIISGHYLSLDQPQRRDAKITVVRIKDNGIVTTVRTDPRNGNYELDVPPGEDYTLVVEAGGYIAHAENFSLPEDVNLTNLKQQVRFEKTSDVERMTLSNFFTMIKKSSSDSNAIVSSEPTNTISSEYRLQDSSQTKLQPIDIKGRIVYVTPPKNIVASKPAEQTHALFEQNVTPAASKEQKKDEPAKTSDVKNDIAVAEPKKEEVKAETKPSEIKPEKTVVQNQETKKEITTPLNKKEEAKTKPEAKVKEPKKEKSTAQEPVKEKYPSKKETEQQQPQAGVSESTIAKDESADDKKIPEDVSNKELVKIAFEDAKQLKVEADSVSKIAEENRQAATEQDNLAKSEMKEAQQLIKAGGKENKEKAKLLMKESEDNSKLANARFKKVKEFEAEAKQLNSEADESVEEAKLLMKINKDNQTSSSKTKNSGKQHAKNPSPETKDSKNVNFAQADLTEPENTAEKNEAAKSEKPNEVKPESKTTEKKPETVPIAVDKNKSAVKSNKTSKSEGETFSESKEKNNDSNKNDGQKNVAEISVKEKTIQPTAKSSADKSLPVVSEKAKQPYVEHKQLLNESKQLAAQADAMQSKIDLMPSSSVRDSLIAKTNEANMESIRKWQQAQGKLNEAKQNDPEIEDKMIEIEKVNQPKEVQQADASTQAEEKKEADQKKNPEKNETAISNVTKSAVKPSANKIENKNGNEENVTSEIPVDTTSAVYPEYAATKTQIKTKQTETITAFAEAMKLNKLAQQKKEEEIDVRDKAVVLTDSKQKYQQLKKADALKHDADSLDQLSQEKFRTAQHITAEVATLNDKAVKLKQKMDTNVQLKQTETPLAKTETKKSQSGNDNVAEANKKTETKVNENLKEENKTAQSKDKKASDEKSSKTKEGKKVEPTVNSETVSSDKTTTKSTEPKSKPAAKENIVRTDLKKQTEPSVQAPLVTEAKVDNEKKSEASEVSVKPEKKIEKKNQDVVAITSESVKSVSENANPLITKEALNVANENIFSIASKPVYTKSNPIPMDPALPDGLIFKVQIGAFRNPLPDGAFKNLQPVTGETTRAGWIRYCVGLFKAFEAANILKGEMRNIGYKDAFVSAYYNGKRIELAEAYSLIRKAGAEEKKLYASVSEKETAVLHSLKIVAPKSTNPHDEDVNSFYGTSTESSKNNSELIEYAVQVGVYKTSKVPSALVPLMPLQTEQTKTGLIRFTTGRYSLYASADSSKRVAINIGVKDAFIVAYKGGSKISLSQVRVIKNENVSDKTTEPISKSASSTSSQIIYKVQLGAFRQKLSDDAVNNFKKISSTEVSQETTASGLTIFYAGSFTDISSAQTAKNGIVSNGIKDAFVVAFSNGKKIPVSKTVSSQVK